MTAEYFIYRKQIETSRCLNTGETTDFETTGFFSLFIFFYIVRQRISDEVQSAL